MDGLIVIHIIANFVVCDILFDLCFVACFGKNILTVNDDKINTAKETIYFISTNCINEIAIKPIKMWFGDYDFVTVSLDPYPLLRLKNVIKTNGITNKIPK